MTWTTFNEYLFVSDDEKNESSQLAQRLVHKNL